jgi:hypothetical protein
MFERVRRAVFFASLAVASYFAPAHGRVAMSSEQPPQGAPAAQKLAAQVPPARPGHLAELEELNMARKAGTRAAYDVFLARHPHSRYVPDARRERAALAP